MNTESATNNILLFQDVISQSFAVYGTCLGIVRDNGLMPHDEDTDMGMMYRDFKPAMIKALADSGFSVSHIFGMSACGMEIRFRKDNVRTDLILFYEHRGLLYNCLWDNDGKNGLGDMIVHSYPKNLFRTERTNGVSHLTEEYLAHVYGDWRTPVKEWCWRSDHLCIDYDLRDKLIARYGGSRQPIPGWVRRFFGHQASRWFC